MADDGGRERSGRHALLIAAGILLSRVMGLIRQRVMAHYLGTSMAAGAFAAALRIPNFLQNLFGEGVLSASFIPVYASLIGKGERYVHLRNPLPVHLTYFTVSADERGEMKTFDDLYGLDRKVQVALGLSS